MEQNKNWAGAGKNGFIINYLKSQIEEALPNSLPQTHIRSSDNSDQITIVCFHKPTEDLSILHSSTINMVQGIFTGKNVTAEKVSKGGHSLEHVTITGTIDEIINDISKNDKKLVEKLHGQGNYRQ